MYKLLCNGIESYHTALIVLCNAGATIDDIANMLDGYSFTGTDGNIYEIEAIV
nr:MAG TPA: hypothetical protein [Caudoviricetes sp.]